MTSTACDDQWAMDRDAAVDELARTVGPTEWRGGGNMRHAGHTITWGEYCMRRHELEEEEEGATKRHDLLTKLAMEHAPDEWGDAATWTYDERQFGWNEYQLRRTELINRPSWDDAPEWAQWLAQDVSGRWMWYGDEPSPVYDAEEWQPESGKFFTASSGAVPAGHDWRDTLEPRPQAQSDIKKCKHCGVTFQRPHLDSVPDDCCTRCHEEIAAKGWDEGEERIDRIAQSDASGDHYEHERQTAAKVSDDRPVCPECVAQDSDPVNHPAHYTNGAIECIDALEAATVNKRGIEAVCTANAIKYLWRYESKGGAEDVRKARWYIDRLLAALEEGQ